MDINHQPCDSELTRNTQRHAGIPAWLNGLDKRLAKVLLWQGFKNKEEIAGALERGDYIPRIGEHSASRISTWLMEPPTQHESKPIKLRIKTAKPPGRPKLEMSAEEIEQSRRASKLLDFLIKRLHLNNDAALARALGVKPATISKLRNGRKEFGAAILIRMHEVTDISIRDLKQFL